MKNAIDKIVKKVKSGYIFDTHFVIGELIKNYSDEYLLFASKYSSSNNLTLTFHGQIGQEINKLDGKSIDKVGWSWSENIHREASKCTCWKKK